MKEVGDAVTVKIQAQDGTISEYNYDYVLMSIGRRPETKDWDLRIQK